jgi:membrane protease YdiL (CAAX protease family)
VLREFWRSFGGESTLLLNWLWDNGLWFLMSFRAVFWYLGGVKRCDYCGKEYPDEATVCAIDRNPLPELLKSGEGSVVAIPPPYIERTKNEAVYPEYRWSARDGWKFLGMIFVFDLMWYSVMRALYWFPPFYHWRWGPYGDAIMHCAFIAMYVSTAAYFARTKTWSSFREAVGLNKRPSQYVWFGVVAALGLQLVGHIFYSLGWKGGYSPFFIRAFEHTHGLQRYLYLFALFAAPFWEEAVFRGFLYKAFRGSYAVIPSVMIILAYTVYGIGTNTLA